MKKYIFVIPFFLTTALMGMQQAQVTPKSQLEEQQNSAHCSTNKIACLPCQCVLTTAQIACLAGIDLTYSVGKACATCDPKKHCCWYTRRYYDNVQEEGGFKSYCME